MKKSIYGNNFCFIKLAARFFLLICVVFVAGCFNRVGNIDNVCELLDDKRSWYKAVSQASEKWQVPKQTLLAFIHQESKFKARAKPPRKRLFGIIPTFRPSSAYGFPQALDSTWVDYQNSSGSWFSERDDFADATDFVGWYIDGSRVRLNLPVENVSAHYLAYHEGRGGYASASYKNKKWLQNVAQKVQNRSNTYAAQLQQCESRLSRKRFIIF